MAVDLAAWGVLETMDAEAAEDAERKAKGLPPLPKLGDRRRPMRDSVEIRVGGERRTVPLPPPGLVYDKTGNLVDPRGM